MRGENEKQSNQSYIFGDTRNNREKENGRKNMARNTRVTAGFMLAAVMAFGGLAANNRAVGADNLYWNVASTNPGNWNTTDANFTGEDTTFAPGDNVEFRSGSYQKTVNVNNGALTVGTMTVNGGYTFSGDTITGTFLTSGGGTNTIENELVFNSGKIDITAGQLKLISAAGNRGVGVLNVESGASLDVSGITNTKYTILNLTGAGTIQAKAGKNFDIYAGNFSGNIGSAGGLLKLSTGTLTLTGTNTYTGETIIDAGTLALKDEGKLNAATRMTINTNSVFDISEADNAATVAALNSAVTNSVVALGSNSLTVKDAGEFQGKIVDTTAGGTSTGGSFILDTGSATKEYILSGANTYTGLTKVTSGTLVVNHANAITSSAGVDLGTTGKLYFAGNGASPSVEEIKILDGAAGSEVLLNADGLKVVGDGSLDAGDFAGVIKNHTGTGGLELDTNSTSTVLVLRGANEYVGDTVITEGILELNNKGSISNSSKVTVATGSTLRLNNGNTVNKVKELAGDGTVDVKDSASTLNVKSANSTDFTGKIIGDGGIRVYSESDTGAGVGNVTLSKVNEYKGATVIDEHSTLYLDGSGSIATSSVVQLNDDATFDISGANSDVSIKKLKGNATSTVNTGSTPGDTNLIITDVRNEIYAGVITGDGDLTIQSIKGTDGKYGVLTLTGANDYSGDTNINSGTLALSGSGKLAAGTDVTLGNAGKFDISAVTLSTTTDPVTVASLKTSNTNDYGAEIALGDTNRKFIVTGATNYAGAFTGTNGDIELRSASTLHGNSSTYAGNITLAGTGDLTLSGEASLAKATLDLQDNNLITTVDTAIGVLDSSRVGTAGGDATIGNSTTLTLNGKSGSMGTFTGDIGSSGSGQLVLAGSGSTFSMSGNIKNNVETTLNSGATLALVGNGHVSDKLTMLGTSTFDVGHHSGDYVFNSELDATSSTSKIVLGANDITFTKSGAFHGTIESDNNAGDVAISGSGVTFDLAGKVNGNVDVKNDANLKYSDKDNKILTITGDLNAYDGGTVNLDLSKTSNAINVGGSVDIDTVLNVKTVSSGTHDLFISGAKDIDISNLTVNNGSTNLQYTVQTYVDTNGKEHYQIVVLKAGQNKQTWLGGESGLWDQDSVNWSGITGVVDGPTKWQNQAGSYAVFAENDAPKGVTVVGTRNFDTMEFSGNNYVISDGQLQILTATSSSTMNYGSIKVDTGKKATINSDIIGGSSVSGRGSADEELWVSGGGHLVLGGQNSTYAGGTTLAGGTKLELTHKNASGTGAVDLGTGSNTLVLNFDDEYVNQITGGNSGSRVEIQAGRDVVLAGSTTAPNDYYGKTVVGDSAILSAKGDNAFSKNSSYELAKGSTLEVLSGTQTIKSVTGDNTTNVHIESGALKVDSDVSGVNYAGRVTGGGSLHNIGTGTLTINNLDTDTFYGKLYAENGAMNINGVTTKDMELNIGSVSNTGKFGTFNITAGEGKNIYLNNADASTSTTFYGTVDIKQGHLMLDREAESLLQNGKLALTGSKSSMDVDDTYTLGDLSLGGSVVYFSSNNNTGDHGKLLVDELDMTASTELRVDTAQFDENVYGKNFFELNKGHKDYIIEANSVKSNISGFANVKEYDGSKLQDTEHDWYQGGEYVGVARFTAGSGVDYTAAGQKGGVYYSQTLYELESDGNSSNMIIDSTPTTASTSTLRDRESTSNRVSSGSEELSARLTGDGGFDFTGTRNIVLKPSTNSSETTKTNDYNGTTVIDMDSKSLSVKAEMDNMFGNTSLLDIRQGVVEVNNKKLAVGAVTGTSDGKLDLGGSRTSNGQLNITTLRSTNPIDTTFNGAVTGYGTITKSGDGIQTFAGANSLTGNINVNQGGLAWAGTLNNGNVNVKGSSTFTQLGSTIGGGVNISDGGVIEGYGTIKGNLNVGDNSTYRMTMLQSDNKLDQTNVLGTTTFGEGSEITASNEVMSFLLSNPNYKFQDVILSGKGLNINNTEWKDGTIEVSLGTFGTAVLNVNGNNIEYDGFVTPVDPNRNLREVWDADGIAVHDVLERSNLADVSLDTLTRYLGNTDLTSKNAVVNARLADAKFLYRLFDSKLGYNRKEALSMMNYDSGYTATLPVQAALDTARTFVGQGLKNRINNLRAARTILASAVPNLGYGYGGYMQPTGAYGSTIVQDTFGYNPGYLGTAYYDPYTGMSQQTAAVAAPGYGYNQQAAYGYGAPAGYAPGYSSAFNVWAGGVGNWTKQKTSSGGIGGYKYDQGGVMVGLDHIAGPVTVGAAFGYSHGKLEDMESLSSDTKINAYSANLYADYNHDSGINAMMFGGYTWFDNKVDRMVAGYRDTNNSADVGGIYADYGVEKTKYKSHAWYVGANVSYDWIPASRLTVTPSIGVEYYDARGKSHQRDLVRNSGVTLSDKVSSIHGRSLTAPIDVNVTYDVVRTWDTKFSVMGNVGYSYEFHNKGPKGSLTWMDVENSPTTAIYGRKPGRSGFNVGAGARLQKKCLSFDVKYDYYHRKDTTSHRLAANVGWEF